MASTELPTSEFPTEYPTVAATGDPTEDSNFVRSILVSIFISLVICAAFIFNIMALVVWAKAKRIRKPTNYFLFTMILADLIGIVLWAILSLIASAGWSWILGAEMCTVQGVISTWCYVITTTLFSAIAFEKGLKLVMPSKHAMAFQGFLVVLFIGSIFIYSSVIALFPIMSWGELGFIDSEGQCHFLFEKSISHLGFLLVVVYVFPLLVGLFFYGVSALKVWWLRRKNKGDGKLVLEEDKKAPKQTFGQLLRRLEAKYKNVASRKDKPELGKDIVWEDATGERGGNQDEDSSSEIDEEEDKNETFRDYSEGRKKIKEREERRKRIFHLRRRDIKFAIVTFFMFVIYMLIWLPFWIASFLWTYQGLSKDLHIFCTVLSYLGLFYKPLMLLLYRPFRDEAKKYLIIKKKEKTEETEPLINDTEDEGLHMIDTGY